MAKPTTSSKNTQGGKSILDGTLQFGAGSSAFKREVSVVTYGNTNATNHAARIFRAPASGAVVKAAYWYPGSTQPHAANEADTWIFSLKTLKGGLALNKNACSLSNQTLAHTACRAIPINNGYATLLSGNGLFITCSISGSPNALKYPAVVIEWYPYSNA